MENETRKGPPVNNPMCIELHRTSRDAYMYYGELRVYHSPTESLVYATVASANHTRDNKTAALPVGGYYLNRGEHDGLNINLLSDKFYTFRLGFGLPIAAARKEIKTLSNPPLIRWDISLKPFPSNFKCSHLSLEHLKGGIGVAMTHEDIVAGGMVAWRSGNRAMEEIIINHSHMMEPQGGGRKNDVSTTMILGIYPLED